MATLSSFVYFDELFNDKTCSSLFDVVRYSRCGIPMNIEHTWRQYFIPFLLILLNEHAICDGCIFRVIISLYIPELQCVMIGSLSNDRVFYSNSSRQRQKDLWVSVKRLGMVVCGHAP